MKKKVRIGNGAGFWGDQLDAAYHLVQSGSLDYLTLEYLAELTMGILAYQKKKDPKMGYVSDFPVVLEKIIPLLKEQPELKIITNAGGLNIDQCLLKVCEVLSKNGFNTIRVAACSGDDILDTDLSSYSHMETDQEISSITNPLNSANVYLGCESIVNALKDGAQIIITGRVADAALTLGPCIHEFNWKWEDYDLLAGGTTAGHLIECGAQVTGGLYTDWEKVEFTNIGYPIAEVYPDSSFKITKPENSGGLVNEGTVVEQLLYEIGDPSCYKTPDVFVDITAAKIKDNGDNSVMVSEIKGNGPSDYYKVSATYPRGYACSGQLMFFGPKAREKALKCNEIIRSNLKRSNFEFENWNAEIIGSGDLVPGISNSKQNSEVVLKITTQSDSIEKLKRFSREFAALITSGPPGLTGYTSAKSKPVPVMEFFPFLINKEKVNPQYQVITAKDMVESGEMIP